MDTSFIDRFDRLIGEESTKLQHESATYEEKRRKADLDEMDVLHQEMLRSQAEEREKREANKIATIKRGETLDMAFIAAELLKRHDIKTDEWIDDVVEHKVHGWFNQAEVFSRRVARIAFNGWRLHSFHKSVGSEMVESTLRIPKKGKQTFCHHEPTTTFPELALGTNGTLMFIRTNMFNHTPVRGYNPNIHKLQTKSELIENDYWISGSYIPLGSEAYNHLKSSSRNRIGSRVNIDRRRKLIPDQPNEFASTVNHILELTSGPATGNVRYLHDVIKSENSVQTESTQELLPQADVEEFIQRAIARRVAKSTDLQS